MSDTFSKVEVITGVARRRRFPTDLKLAIVAETMQPGMSISYVARQHGLSPSLVFRWIAVALNLAPCFTPVESPESNGMAEAFVKTFKRDYVRVSPIANAAEASIPACHAARRAARFAHTRHIRSPVSRFRRCALCAEAI